VRFRDAPLNGARGAAFNVMTIGVFHGQVLRPFEDPLMAIAAVESVLTCGVRPAPAVILARLRAELPAMQARGETLDRGGRFPKADLQFLRACGALEGFGRVGVAPVTLMEALRLVGRGNLSVGRIFEGHINGAHLVDWYGDEAQRARLAEQLAAGEVFGVWNTEKPPGVRLERRGSEACLTGRKCFATGAGHIDHVIVTASLTDGRKQMVIADAHDLSRADASGWKVRGMRATLSGLYDLTDLPANAATRLGAPGDYEREPRFSAGAWRFCAVQLGGVERVIGLLRNHLVNASAGDDPIHRARFGQAMAAARSAYLWVREAAVRAQSEAAGPAEIAFVLMTRGIVERAGLAAIEAAERSVGTRAFFEDDPLDRACRDLALYLRQPAPDQALDRAASAFIAEDCWRDDPLW
jgi:alkylation response protein AidB-like acyl-CoA dehydrogenase